jgi:preprotein translocase subunit Sec61beta
MDTIPKFVPNFKAEDNRVSIPFSPDFIVPIGFLVIIILILLFLKTRKK